jgi:hypothetical protein
MRAAHLQRRFLRSPGELRAPRGRLLRTFGDIDDLLSPREPVSPPAVRTVQRRDAAP